MTQARGRDWRCLCRGLFVGEDGYRHVVWDMRDATAFLPGKPEEDELRRDEITFLLSRKVVGICLFRLAVATGLLQYSRLVVVLQMRFLFRIVWDAGIGARKMVSDCGLCVRARRGD